MFFLEPTWEPLKPIHGSAAYVNISHRVTANIQVSLACENLRIFRLSGAHLQNTSEISRWGRGQSLLKLYIK